MKNDLSGEYELANDIDASETSGWNWNAGRGVHEGFVPIGTSNDPFTGKLDGKGFNITGLYINREAFQSGAFFQTLALIAATDGAIIQNVNLVDVDISAHGTERANASSLIGRLEFSECHNCTASGQVQAVSDDSWVNASGLIGMLRDSIATNCHTSCVVTGQAGIDRCYVAGFTRLLYEGAEVSNCSATGDVLAIGGTQIINAAGFVSTIYGASHISDCFASGDVSLNVNPGRGLASGFINTCYDASTLTNCHAEGNISAVTGEGGSAEGFGGGPYNAGTTYTRCYCTGDVEITSALGQAHGRDIYAAGFVVYWGSGFNAIECYSTGDVTATCLDGRVRAAGFVVSPERGRSQRCYCTGNVVAVGNQGNVSAGGFAAWTWHFLATDCYCTGSVHAETTDANAYAGGFTSDVDGGDSDVVNCYSTSAVSGVVVNGTLGLGGFCEWHGGGNITDCFWDTQTSGQATSDGGEGKTTAEMRNIETFAEWDIQRTAVSRNNRYPFLSWEIGNSPTWLLSGGDAPTNPHPVGYADDYRPEKTALELLRNVEMEAGGRVFVDKSGNLHYDSRFARNA